MIYLSFNYIFLDINNIEFNMMIGDWTKLPNPISIILCFYSILLFNFYINNIYSLNEVIVLSKLIPSGNIFAVTDLII